MTSRYYEEYFKGIEGIINNAKINIVEIQKKWQFVSS